MFLTYSIFLNIFRGSPSAWCTCAAFFPTAYTWQSLYLRVPWSGVPLLAVWTPLGNLAFLPTNCLTITACSIEKRGGSWSLGPSSHTEAPQLSFFESVKLFFECRCGGCVCGCVWVSVGTHLPQLVLGQRTTTLDVDPSNLLETRSLLLVCAVSL